MSKPVFIVIVTAALAGCGTVIDFGPEPGSPGDEGFWHYQPQLHGPDAPPREPSGSAPAAPAPEAAPALAQPVLPPPPPPAATPPAPTSEAMFNDAIRRAVAAGDIDRALRLLEEAERLGSPSARPTFIEALEGRGR